MHRSQAAVLAPVHHPWTLLSQCILIMAGLAGITLAPPSEGPMLLMPIGTDAGSAINIALNHDARLLGAGPLRGTIVVAGRREAIVPAMLAAGIFVIAATPALCGELRSSPRRKLP